MVASHGQRSIGDTVRGILKSSMTDEVMAKYNRTGARNGRQLPEIFQKCILGKLDCDDSFFVWFQENIHVYCLISDCTYMYTVFARIEAWSRIEACLV